MKTSLITQPLASSDNLAGFIRDAVKPPTDSLRVVVAWAKRSGLARVAPELRAFTGRGGKLLMIVGVSEGGATVEGLELVSDLASEAYVYHDVARTFHPKVYLARGNGYAYLFIGSSNLTAGGLAWNYEAGLRVELSLDDPDDAQLADDVDAWIDALIAEGDVCKPLTAQLLTDIIDSPALRVGTESSAHRPSSKNGSAPVPEDDDSVTAGSVAPLFGSPNAKMRPLPPSPAIPGLSVSPSSASGKQPAQVSTLAPKSGSPSSSMLVVRRWFKEMDHTAAQQKKGPNSRVTGNLRLSQSQMPINHRTYFYKEFFGGLPWAPTPGKATELEVIINFDVSVGGASLGQMPMRVSHDPQRISGQGNVPTVLHWGTGLGAILRATNYVGHVVTLERDQRGGFRLVIAGTSTGGFIV